MHTHSTPVQTQAAGVGEGMRVRFLKAGREKSGLVWQNTGVQG